MKVTKNDGLKLLEVLGRKTADMKSSRLQKNLNRLHEEYDKSHTTGDTDSDKLLHSILDALNASDAVEVDEEEVKEEKSTKAKKEAKSKTPAKKGKKESPEPEESEEEIPPPKKGRKSKKTEEESPKKSKKTKEETPPKKAKKPKKDKSESNGVPREVDFLGCAVGSQASRINAALTKKPQKIAEIAEAAEAPKSATTSHLRRLAGLNKIAKSEDGYSLIGDAPKKKAKTKKASKSEED